MDELLNGSETSNVGCHFGNLSIVSFSNGDDLTLLAPSLKDAQLIWLRNVTIVLKIKCYQAWRAWEEAVEFGVLFVPALVPALYECWPLRRGASQELPCHRWTYDTPWVSRRIRSPGTATMPSHTYSPLSLAQYHTHTHTHTHTWHYSCNLWPLLYFTGPLFSFCLCRANGAKPSEIIRNKD